MSENIFTVKDQDTLNSIIHRPQDTCDGTCEYCSKFHRAGARVAVAQDKGITITLTENTEPVERTGYFLIWCEECATGEHAGFWDACHWGQRHAESRHAC